MRALSVRRKLRPYGSRGRRDDVQEYFMDVKRKYADRKLSHGDLRADRELKRRERRRGRDEIRSEMP
jgi:hypothetical protein